MGADQETKHRETKACGGCGTVVLHRQLVTYGNSSGFKYYDMVPVQHRRPDGGSCSFKADLRSTK